MSHILNFLLLILIIPSCGQSENKKLELNLKERELALKEKELELRANDSATYKDSTMSNAINSNLVSDNKFDTTKNVVDLKIPSGYRIPTSDDINKTPDWREVAKQGKNYAKPYYTQGDFNGDGISDKVYILIQNNSGEKTIFSFLSGNGDHKPIMVDKNVVVGIYRILKGEDVCIYEDDGFEIKLRKTLKFDAIGFSSIEAGDPGAYLFNPTTLKFEVYYACVE